MTQHSIGLVRYDAFWLAWVLDLPGCLAGGRDMEEVEHNLPLVLAEHIAWLRRHGEAAGGPGGWEIAETVDAPAFEPAGGEFCFRADLAPLGREELERGLSRMQYARSDLLAAVDGLPDTVLDWEVPDTAVGATDAWAPEARTIRGIVEHVLQLEVYYRDGLRDAAASGIFEKVDDPAEERRTTVELLASLSDEGRSRVYHPVRRSRTVPDEWTVRKVLRRVISHERAHTAEIVQRRAWLLLGVPRVRAG